MWYIQTIDEGLVPFGPLQFNTVMDQARKLSLSDKRYKGICNIYSRKNNKYPLQVAYTCVRGVLMRKYSVK